MKSTKTILILCSLLLASSLWAVSASGPTGTLQINSGAIYASSSDVILTIKADDSANIAGMQVGNGTAYRDTEAYVETKSWTLTTGDGLKTVRVRFIDLLGNTTTPGILANITLDTVAPVLSLIGSSSMEIWQGESYLDQGATATDTPEGDISAQIVTSGLPIDTSVLGTSTVSYNVSDSAGNLALAINRLVLVLATSSATSTPPEPATTTPPVEEPVRRSTTSIVPNFNPLLLENTITPTTPMLKLDSEIDSQKLAELNENLRIIKRKFLMLKNPELRVLFAEQDKLWLNFVLAQNDEDDLAPTEEVLEIPTRRPWWKIW